MSALRYYTEFYSCAAFRHEKSALYRIEIYGPEGEAKEMTLDGEDPAVIQWQEVAKTDPVQGSSLTLRIVSESDREYIHLYTTNVGEWWVKVFRNGNLYWTGILDTELYEEPYSTGSNYELEVTFSDFGALERIDYDGQGLPTLADLLNGALSAVGLSDIPVRHTRSTRLPDEIFSTPTEFDFSKVAIDAGNFYDEDAEPMSWREVLDAVFQTMALRMVQRNGIIEIFDLNAAYNQWSENEVYWTDTDAELGTDVTYNKVTTTLSVYADIDDSSDDSDHDTALAGNSGVKYMLDADWDATKSGENPEGFYLAYGAEDTSTIELTPGGGAQLFRMDSAYSGEDAVGVIWSAYGNTESNYKNNLIRSDGNSFPAHGPVNFCSGYSEQAAEWTSHMETFYPVFSLKKSLSLVNVTSTKHMLKLTMDFLVDARYNPYEDGDYNEKDNMDDMKKEFHIVYVPIRIKFTSFSGSVMYYTNWRGLASIGTKPIPSMWQWEDSQQGGDKSVVACLCYYDSSDPMKTSALDGWTSNKQSIGDPRYATKIMKKRGSGEYIPLPPSPGVLTVEVGRGFVWRFGDNLKPGWYGIDSRLYGKLRWLAYKAPKLELVKKDGTEIDEEDIKDSAWIVKSAKESLDLDLKVGTPGNLDIPTARAFLRYAGSGAVIRKFERAGVTDRLERLLIGTVYSQYAKRNTILSGTCELIPGMTTLTDAADEGGRYIMISDVQHLIKEESEITMVEYAPDDYEGIEITSE